MEPNINTVIIDDEVRSRSVLTTMLSKHCKQINIVGEASTIEEGVALIQLKEPQLVFLDIALNVGTGFDILGQVLDINFKIIFVTAYDSFAIKAIKWSAIDYLLKPVDPEELIASVKKAQNVIEENNDRVSEQQTKGCLGLPSMEGLKLIEIDSITRCEAKGTYTEFYFLDQPKIIVSKPLHNYEEILAEYGFIRIHNSHLINLKQVKEYIKGRGGNVVMKDNTVIAVAARKKEEFLKRILF